MFHLLIIMRYAILKFQTSQINEWYLLANEWNFNSFHLALKIPN